MLEMWLANCSPELQKKEEKHEANIYDRKIWLWEDSESNHFMVLKWIKQIILNYFPWVHQFKLVKHILISVERTD